MLTRFPTMKGSVAVLGLLSAYFACHVFCANHHPHQVSDSMHFYYDPTMHHFIAATSNTCFMVSLTHLEQDHVHTTQGIEDLELKMMREWLGKLNEVKVYHDDTHLPQNIKHWCSNKDIFLLERNMTVSGTQISPLASTMP